MTSTRERVLRTLLRRSRCSIKELADAVGINPISVRHHIAKLEAESLVAYEDERHGVGRPRRMYFLTEAGMERFPSRYLRLITRLLGQMKETLPEATVDKLFTQMADDIAAEMASEADIAELEIEDRLDLIQTLLTEEGFTVEWKLEGDEYHIREVGCPYYKVGQDHPEVCVVDETLISKILDVPATKIRCILDGDTHCTYVVPSGI